MQDLTNKLGARPNLDDLKKLKELQLDGAIIGKAIYEQRITLHDLKNL